MSPAPPGLPLHRCRTPSGHRADRSAGARRHLLTNRVCGLSSTRVDADRNGLVRRIDFASFVVPGPTGTLVTHQPGRTESEPAGGRRGGQASSRKAPRQGLLDHRWRTVNHVLRHDFAKSRTDQ